MKVIIKLCLVLSIAFTAVSFFNAPSAEAATANSCNAEAVAAEKALKAYEKQVFKSLFAAIKAQGLIKGTSTYIKQTKELAKLAKKVKDLNRKSFAAIDCVLKPIK